MGDYRSSSHVYLRCKYHIVWTPKFRFKILGQRAIPNQLEDAGLSIWKLSLIRDVRESAISGRVTEKIGLLPS